jgi:transcriptional regulator of acetoin/glycerol metabolism
LNREEQSALFRWLDESNQRTQVVSTTAQPLFPLVGRGLFDEALYYRLNVVHLCVDSSSADALAEGAA